MRISATVHDAPGRHEVTVSTEGTESTLAIGTRDTGRGSASNGGELLTAALATCFVNDLHREAARRGLVVGDVRVTVESEFGGPGDPARTLAYSVRVESPEDRDVIEDLVRATDRLAEVHNTIRAGLPVVLTDLEVGEP